MFPPQSLIPWSSMDEMMFGMEETFFQNQIPHLASCLYCKYFQMSHCSLIVQWHSTDRDHVPATLGNFSPSKRILLQKKLWVSHIWVSTQRNTNLLFFGGWGRINNWGTQFYLASKPCHDWFMFNKELKVKVKLSPFFNWAPRHEGVLGEWRYRSTHSLTSALDGGEWLASLPGRFTSSERAPGTHWIGGCVGPRAVLDAVVKRKIPSPLRESNPRTPIGQPV
jgi:hypothetical protein